MNISTVVDLIFNCGKMAKDYVGVGSQFVKKILQYNDGKDPQKIMVSRENGVLVFRKEGSEDYPQILFRS